MQTISALSLGTLLSVSSILISAPAEAARLRFDFTTQSGGIGSFLLNTETPAVPEAELSSFYVFMENQAYIGAVSDFSFASPNVSFEGLGADYGVFPSFDFGELLGVPEVTGAFTTLYAPAGCSEIGFCSTEFPIAYTGDLSILPELVSNPSAYANGFDFAITSPTEGLVSDPLTSFSVTSVPEPSAMLSLLLLGGLSLSGSLRRGSVNIYY